MLNFKPAKPMLVALAACAATMATSGAAFADDAQQTQALKDQLKVLQQQVDAMQKQLEALSKKSEKAPAAAEGPAVAKEKPADAEPRLTKLLSGFYATLDVSFDDTTKGMNGFVAYHLNDAGTGLNYNDPKGGGAGPVGRVGYMPALSTNKSVIGYRGAHRIEGTNTDFIFQIETQPAITSSPGLNTSQYAQSNVTKAGIGYGDSFIGFSNKDWGKIKFGTVYSPYKKSTDRMNPFSGMLGDYAVIMGNSGGDNRVEFGTRLDHSFWYESPKLADVFSFDVLVSPGQNRTYNDVVQSSGSPDCNGGNMPGSGNLLLNCDDGGFDAAYSVDLKYESGPLYVTAAWELHKGVNRNSDGIGSNSPYYATLYTINPDGTCSTTSPNIDCASYNTYQAEYPLPATAGTPGYINDTVNETAL